eukprot:TRINITY_DN10898_c0_g1_i2.p1 TRINITY_DN10898_c0_g1~~TRINITY_DN10898_c0_g1_i2.p1  ORF type:complete len:1058 (-),score=242.57 TRINITY_DN10898_c0_g1_i2:143-3316(-)
MPRHSTVSEFGVTSPLTEKDGVVIIDTTALGEPEEECGCSTSMGSFADFKSNRSNRSNNLRLAAATEFGPEPSAQYLLNRHSGSELGTRVDYHPSPSNRGLLGARLPQSAIHTNAPEGPSWQLLERYKDVVTDAELSQAFQRLENLLPVGGGEEGTCSAEMSKNTMGSTLSGASSSSWQRLQAAKMTLTEYLAKVGKRLHAALQRLVQSKFYALFAPDLDQMLGDKESHEDMLIVSTVIFLLFCSEVVLQSLCKAHYMGSSYFWLDFVAALSLLPDTLIISLMVNSNAFAAGRSSRLARLARVASRSAKVTRLNRLARLARVTALVPRIAAMLGGRTKEKDVLKQMDKHLKLIFKFIDQDADGLIPRIAAIKMLSKALEARGEQDQKESMMTAAKLAAGTHSAAHGPVTPVRRAATNLSFYSSNTTTSTHSLAEMALDDDVTYETFKAILMSDDWVRESIRKTVEEEVTQKNTAQRSSSRHSEQIGVQVALGVLMLLFVLSLVQPDIPDISLDKGLEFCSSLVEKSLGDVAAAATIPAVVHETVNQWLRPSSAYSGARDSRKLVYLDLNKKVYCNELVAEPWFRSCTDVPITAPWLALRRGLEVVGENISDHHLRPRDYLIADVAPGREKQEDMADAIYSDFTISVAVLDNSEAQRQEAMLSLATTIVVTVCILGGIAALTRDMTFLSVNLLTPLEEVAEQLRLIVEMGGIAGCAPSTEPLCDDAAAKAEADSGMVSEVRIVKRTLESMKTALKSWGKYVPWPVVKGLLQSRREARLDVEEQELTMFFSDIASFTTIVEGLVPAESLLLLSRYFHDMSRTIDEHGGVLVEFIGDAIQAIYGAPVKQPAHATQGVQAAVRMMESLGRMNKRFKQWRLPAISVRCGLHTGKVLVGNMGFAERMKYGIVGEEAGVPPKLEEMNKTYGSCILMSETTAELVAADTMNDEKFFTRPVDIVYLRPYLPGPPKPEKIYEVRLPEKDPERIASLELAMKMHARALEQYRLRDFEQAAASFKEVSTAMQSLYGQDDGPSLLMAQRSEALKQKAPPPTWQGVWDGDA